MVLLVGAAVVFWRRQYESGLSRREVEVTLRHANQIQAVLDNAFDGILTVDQRGRIQTANPAAEKIFRRPCSEMAGLPLDSTPAERKNALAALVREDNYASLAADVSLGLPTFRDILEQLIRPGRDPRHDLPAPILRSDILKIEDLRTYFYSRSKQAFIRSVDGVSLEVAKGETLGVVGESGKGKPQADIFWGGEGTLFDALAVEGLLEPVKIPKKMWDEIPATLGKPVGLPLKDPKGFWVGTTLEPYVLIYQPKLLKQLGVEVKDWDDLLNPKLKGQIAQCTPDRSSSSHATCEVVLQTHGWEKGWEWLTKLAANTGIFTARSRDVPNVVAKGEFAVGFAVPELHGFYGGFRGV